MRTLTSITLTVICSLTWHHVRPMPMHRAASYAEVDNLLEEKVKWLFDKFIDRENRLTWVIVNNNSAVPGNVLKYVHDRSHETTVTVSENLLSGQYQGISSESMLKVSTVVLFQDHFLAKNLSGIAKRLQVSSIWHMDAKFMIVITQTAHDDSASQVKQLSQDLWRGNMFNAVIVHSREVKNGDRNEITISTHTYDPFIEKGSSVFVKEFHGTSDLFARKLLNLHGNRIRASIVQNNPMVYRIKTVNGANTFAGSDVNMIATVAKYMNADLEIKYPSDKRGFGFVNGSHVTGSSGDVAHGRADIAANSRYIKGPLLTWLSYTYPHDQDDKCFLVPKAQRIAQYKHLFLPFTLDVWTWLVLSYPIAALGWFSIRKFSSFILSNHVTTHLFDHAVLETFRSMISGAMNTVPKTFPERVVLLLWSMFSIIMTNAFQGSLTSYLTVPKYLPDINTVEELDKSGIKILVYMGVKQNENARNSIQLYDQFVEIGELKGKKTSSEPMGMMMDEHVAKYFMKQKMNYKDGYPLYHLMEECYSVMYVSYEVTKNSPLLASIDVLIQRMVEGGLFGKWQSDTIHTHTLQGRLTRDTKQVSRAQTMALGHLQTAFFLLILGLSIGIFCFLTELGLKRFAATHPDEKQAEEYIDTSYKDHYFISTNQPNIRPDQTTQTRL